MKVLVTGTDGYIGSILGPYLMERGHTVVGLDTGFYRDGWLFPMPTTSVTKLQKDIRRIDERDLEGFDAIVHLAELSNDPLGQHNPTLTREINFHGSKELALKAKRAGIQRFVYSSSCSVYGVGTSDFLTEESEPNPQTVYAECKVLVEQALVQLRDDSFAPTMLRNATAFGPSPRMRFDLVLNNLAGLAWTTHEIRMTSDGTPWRPIVHIRDIAEAVTCVLDAPVGAVRGQIFNVGDTAQNYQVREIAEIIAAVFPDCRLSFGTSDSDNRSYRVSFQKIRQHLPAFTCHHDARSGAEQLCQLFETIEMSSDTFNFRAYTRLKQLDHLLSTGQIDNKLFWRI